MTNLIDNASIKTNDLTIIQVHFRHSLIFFSICLKYIAIKHPSSRKKDGSVKVVTRKYYYYKKRNNLSFFFEMLYVGCVFIMLGKNQSFDKSENTVNNVSQNFQVSTTS